MCCMEYGRGAWQNLCPLFLFRLFSFEDGEAEVVLDGKDADEEDAEAADYLDEHYIHAQPIAQTVDETTDDTGEGINFLAEDEGDFIDEDITEHTTGCACDGTHDDGYP